MRLHFKLQISQRETKIIHVKVHRIVPSEEHAHQHFLLSFF